LIDAWLSFETLLKLTKKLRSALGDVALVLVGVSHNPAVRRALIRAAVEHGLGKSLVLLPPQPYEKIPLFVNAADLIVAPCSSRISPTGRGSPCSSTLMAAALRNLKTKEIAWEKEAK
jgi:hypothetical protein